MGYLYKRGKIFYTATKKGGRWVWKSARTPYKDVAKIVLRERERKALTNEDEIRSISLEKYCRLALDRQRRDLRSKTVVRYEEIVANLIVRGSPLRGKLVHEITGRLAAQYVENRLAAGRAATTVKKEITWLLGALKQAPRAGHTSREAVAILREELSIELLPDLHRASRRRTRVLLPHEIPGLESAVGRNDNLQDAIAIALNHGLRAGNILELREEQIDFTCDPSVLRYESDETKNEAPLLVLLCPKVREILWRRWQGIPGRRLFHDFRPAWKRAIKRAGLKDFRFHDFRRSYITYRLAAGIDVKSVQSEVGHRDSRMTLDCYAQAIKDPAVRAWALRNFRFPWDPPMALPPENPQITSQITSHLSASRRRHRVSD